MFHIENQLASLVNQVFLNSLVFENNTKEFHSSLECLSIVRQKLAG